MAPTLTFASVGGIGDGAAVTVAISDGMVNGVDAIHKEGGAIGASARATISTSSAAPDGTPDKSPIISLVTITSRVITLNGKSHVITKRLPTSDGAAASSQFPVRLILHATQSATPTLTLMQRVYLGQCNGVAYAGAVDSTVAGGIGGAFN